MIIEVCCGGVVDAVVAERAGADRIELTQAMGLGGLTPSLGTFLEVKKRTSLPIMVMLRPRESGYYYQPEEIEAMGRDAKIFKEYGAEGIVFGFLHEDGSIDMDACQKIMTAAPCMEYVFHRAFDLVPDPVVALDQLTQMGVHRLLTKGQKNTIEDGFPLFDRLKKRAGNRLTLMSGGVRAHNIEWILENLNPTELHIGAFTFREDPTVSNNPSISFGKAGERGESQYQTVDEKKLRELIKTLRRRT